MSDLNNTLPTVICKNCGEAKVKTFDNVYHRSPTKGDSTKRRRKYKDEKGQLWHGTKCPQCASTWRNSKYSKVALSLKAELLEKLKNGQ